MWLPKDTQRVGVTELTVLGGLKPAVKVIVLSGWGCLHG